MGELGPKSRPEFENYHVLSGEAVPAVPWLGGKAQIGTWTPGTLCSAGELLIRNWLTS